MAYAVRISDVISDVCSSDLALVLLAQQPCVARFGICAKKPASMGLPMPGGHQKCPPPVHASDGAARRIAHQEQFFSRRIRCESGRCQVPAVDLPDLIVATDPVQSTAAFGPSRWRSEERRVGKGCVSPVRSRGSPYP